MNPADARRHSDGHAVRLSAALVAVAASLAALPLGLQAINLLRDQLHIHCSWVGAEAAGDGTWACSDGIGYLGFGLFLAAMWLATAIGGPIIAVLVRDGRDARGFLLGLATVSAAWILGGTFLGAATLVGDEHAPAEGLESWVTAVGPSAIPTFAAVAAAIAALIIRGATARVLLIAGALLLGYSTALEPGVGINLLPAAGLLTAAAIRSPIRAPRITDRALST
ncbi:hypothetical protein [Microbacterium sp. NPDC055357]